MHSESGANTGPFARFIEPTILGLVIVAFLAFHLLWIEQDTRPVPEADSNHNMFGTLLFMDKVQIQGIGQIGRALVEMSVDGRPPLYQLLSVPFLLLFGRSTDSGLYLNLLFGILLLVSTYQIGKLAQNGRAGLVSALVVAGYPPLVSLMHFYRPHFTLSACVALTVWLLLLLQKNKTIKTAWLLGLSLAFGLLIHPTFLWVAPIPAVIICLHLAFFENQSTSPRLKEIRGWLRDRIRQPLVLRGLLPAALVAIIMVLAWYLTAGQSIFSTLTRIHSEEVVEFRGEEFITLGFEDVPPSFWWYVVTSPNALTTVFVALLAVGVAVSLFRRRFSDFILLAFFLTGYIILSLQGTLGWRYFSPLLPVLAALTGTWVGRLRQRAASLGLTLLCALVAVISFGTMSWGIQTWNRPMASALGVLEDARPAQCAAEAGLGFCPAPPVAENWPVTDILKPVVEDPACKESRCVLSVVNQSGHLSSSVFQYYAQKDFPETPLSAPLLGYKRGGIPLNLPAILNGEYIVYEDMPEVVGQTFNAAVLRLLKSPPPGFADAHREVAAFPLPNGNTARLVRRIAPLTLREAQATIDALELEEKYKVMQYAVLAPLHAQQGDFEQAVANYRLALKFSREPQAQAEIHFGLAQSYEASGQTDLAIQEFEAVIQSAPQSEYAKRAQEQLDQLK